MRKFKYARVSSSTRQNTARQIDKDFEMYIDKCSGTIPFLQRPEASKLFNSLSYGDFIEIESVDRIGRDKMDMLSTLESFKELGVNVKIKNLGIESFPEEGKYNPIFDIVTSLLSALSTYEYEQIKERTEQGITIAKAQGKYKGRKKGTILSRDVFIERNKKSFLIIKKHPNLSLRELSALCEISHMKVKKLKDLL